MNQTELTALIIKQWGSITKPRFLIDYSLSNPKPRLLDFVDFSELNQEAKVLLCEILMIHSSPGIGSYQTDGDIQWLLHEISNDDLFMNSGVDRRIPPLKISFQLLSANSQIDGLSAVVTPYLLAETEYLSRKNSRYLDYDGKVIKRLPNHISNIKIGKRVNQVHIAYKLFLYRNNSPLAQRLKAFDKKISNFYIVSSSGQYRRLKNGVTGHFVKVTNIAGRIQQTRNAIMHGEWNFLGTEAYFYALLIAIFYYYG